MRESSFEIFFNKWSIHSLHNVPLGYFLSKRSAVF